MSFYQDNPSLCETRCIVGKCFGKSQSLYSAPSSFSFVVFVWSMNMVFPVTCAHLSSCGLSHRAALCGLCTHSTWCIPSSSFGYLQPFSLLLGAWQASHLGAGRTSQFCFFFYTELACDLLDLHLFLLLRASRADAVVFLPFSPF